MFYRRFFLVSLLTILPVSFALPQLLEFSRIDVEQGLSQNTVTCMYQDTHGFLWIGTLDGLNKYDGTEFKVYSKNVDNPNSISDNSIGDIYGDSKENIWVCNSSNVSIFNNKTDQFDNIALPKGTLAKRLIEDKDSTLWLASSKGLYKYKTRLKNFEFYPLDMKKCLNSKEVKDLFDNQPDINDITSSQETPYLWLATASYGLIKLNIETGDFMVFQSNPNKDNLLSNNIQDITLQQNRFLWLATGAGVSKLTISNNTFEHYNSESHNLPDDFVYVVYVDKNNTVWAGANGGGLNRLNLDTKQFFNYTYSTYNNQSLSNNDVTYIYETRDDVFWVGTYNGGVNKYDPFKRKFAHVTQQANTQNTLSAKSLRKIIEDKEGNVFVATVNNGLNYIDKKENKVYHISTESHPNLKSNRINSLLIDKNENVWLGHAEEGVNCMKFYRDKDGNGFKFSFLPDDDINKNLAGLGVLDLQLDSKGMIWVASYGGISKINTISNQVHQYVPKVNEEDPINKIRTIKIQDESTVWAGSHGGGLLKLNTNTGTFKVFTTDQEQDNALSSDLINCIHIDTEGTLWIGTGRGGMNSFNEEDNRFEHYTEQDGLSNNYIYGILEDEEQKLWISTNKGLSRFNKQTKVFKNYQIYDGLQNAEFNTASYYKSKSGTLYFGGVNGFNYFNPSEILVNTHEIPIAFTDFKVLNQSIVPGESEALPHSITEKPTITLTHQDYMFSISYAGLMFSNSENHQYAYKMEGFNKDWIENDKRKTATFTNLDAGKYTFKVKAKNSDGILNEEEASITINILPPWWNTWLFRSLAMISLVVAGIASYKYKTQNLKYRQRILEQQVQERTLDLREKNNQVQLQAEELGKQKEHLESTNEELKSKNLQIQSSINVALSIQQSILPHSSSLDKISKNHFVIYQPKDIVSGDFYWYGTLNNIHFVAAVDCTGHGVPGAFMSLISCSLFDKVLESIKPSSPAELLEEVQKMLHLTLLSDKRGSLHGMDVAVLAIQDKGSFREVQFAGARRPLYYILSDNKQLLEIKGDKISINNTEKKQKSFSNHVLKCGKDTCLYIGSDGLVDQNNEKRKRLGSPILKKVLLENAELPMSRQKEVLLKTLSQHMGTSTQRDDILLLGIKI